MSGEYEAVEEVVERITAPNGNRTHHAPSPSGAWSSAAESPSKPAEAGWRHALLVSARRHLPRAMDDSSDAAIRGAGAGIQ